MVFNNSLLFPYFQSKFIFFSSSPFTENLYSFSLSNIDKYLILLTYVINLILNIKMKLMKGNKSWFHSLPLWIKIEQLMKLKYEIEFKIAQKAKNILLIIIIIILIIIYNLNNKNIVDNVNFDTNIYNIEFGHFKITDFKYFYSLKFKLVKIEYNFNFYNKKNELIIPSELILYDNLQIICNIEILNSNIIILLIQLLIFIKINFIDA